MLKRQKYLLLCCFIFSSCSEEPSEKLVPLDQKFDPKNQAFAFAIPNLKPVAVAGLKASDCKICHTEIYEEWRQSTHANALRDIQFQSEITKSDSPKWLCLNCHIPVENQRRLIVTNLKDGDVTKPIGHNNPLFDQDMQKEAITCAACHIRKKEGSDESIIVGAFESPFAPHPVKVDKKFLRNICFRCHDPQGPQLTENLLCWFKTKEELQIFQKSSGHEGLKKRDCVDCHMPIKERRLSSLHPTAPMRKSHQHHWVGSGIPKWYKGFDSIFERGYFSALGVSVKPPVSKVIQGKKTLTTSISLTNLLAEHHLPTGDPERFIQITASLINDEENVLHTEKYRIGQIWKWSPAKKISDNRLKMNEKREWNVSMPFLEKASRLEISAWHVRLSSASAKAIMSAKNVDEKLLADGQKFVCELPQHYPMALCVFKESINLETSKRKLFKQKELLEISKKEQGKSLKHRAY